jgi:hypothetical protein
MAPESLSCWFEDPSCTLMICTFAEVCLFVHPTNQKVRSSASKLTELCKASVPRLLRMSHRSSLPLQSQLADATAEREVRRICGAEENEQRSER